MADKTVVVRIVLRANQLSSGLRGAASDVNRFAVDVERGSAKAGSSALALGAASATAGKLMLVGIGGAMAVSAKAAIDFESSLAGVAKTTDLTGSAFAKAGSPLAAFGEALRSLSMRVPLNVNELAAIAEAGGQLGIEVPNLIEFTEVMAALGVSTNLSATEAASGLARFANIMRTGQDQFGRLGSILVDLGNNFATTESEILHFGTRLAAVGKTVGMTEEEVFGLSAAMTSLGVPAERGATALQRIFLDMQSAVEGGGESLESWATATRMTTEEFSALFRESPAQVFAELVKQLDATTEAGGSASGVLRDLGIIEQRSIQVLLASAGGWETVAEAIDGANTAGAEGNALFEESARRYGTSASQIQILSNAFNDLRIEIGNTLLGSGGLSAGIDFLREFFRIVKDNLPLIGNLAKVLATIGAIRIGANLIKPMTAAVTALKGMGAAASGATAKTAALSLATLGLNTAVFGAIAIVGILITKWAAAAAKAAELRQAARDLQEQMEQGADPIEAFVQAFRDQGILTDERVRTLNDLGISEEKFIQALLDEESALRQLNTVSAASTAGPAQLAAILGGLADEELIRTRLGFSDAADAALDFNSIMGNATALADGFFQAKSDEVVNGLIEAGEGAKFSTDQLRGMADEAVRIFGMKTPAEDIVASFTTGTPGKRKPGGGAEQAERDAERVNLSWQQMVMAAETGSDKIDDFWDALEDSSIEFSDTLSESFQEVREAIMEDFPWDEYEQKTIESLSGIIEAQDLYLEDLRAGFELQSELAGTASAQVLAYLEDLDPGTKAALARYRESNQEGFDLWLGDLEANLIEAEVLTNDFWTLKLPGNLQAGFANLVSVARANAVALELPGEETAEAFIEGVESQMAAMPDQYRDQFMEYIAAAFQDKNFLRSIGLDAGNPLVDGFVDAIRGMASKVNPVLTTEIRKVKDRLESRQYGYDIKSPSRYTFGIGEDITRGLFQGMESEFDRQLAHSTFALAPVMAGPAPTVNVNVPETTARGARTTNITIVSPQTQNLRGDIQQGLLADSLVTEVEGF